MFKLIANKDVMREVLSHIEDRELLKICSVNRRCWNIICDDNFLKRRLSKYPDVEKYKEDQKTYKNFFSRISFLVSEMKLNYKFSYNLGNIIEQYDLLRSFGNKMNTLLLLASEKGELSIVKYAVENKGDIHFSQDEPLFRACYYAHIEIVKYLLTKTTESEFYNEILRSICRIVEDKHLSIVKYFIETVENIDLDLPLGSACESGHVETIKYLIQKGANKFHPYVVRMANLNDTIHILQDL